jgi:hypothetical protein
VSEIGEFNRHRTGDRGNSTLHGGVAIPAGDAHQRRVRCHPESQIRRRVPSVNQQLATVLMLFDRLVTGQVVPMNPAAAVPRLNHVVNTGKAPVLEAAKSTPAVILRHLRDRALLATLTYFFGRITALKMRVDVHS